MVIATAVAHRRWTQTDITTLRGGILAGHGTNILAQTLGRELADLSRMAARLNLTLGPAEST